MREVEQPSRTVDDVVARLAEIDASLPPGDGVACFNRMYLTVTTLVRDRIGAGFFADLDRMSALDVTFADLYLAAVAAAESGEPVPEAWEPLFERRGDPRVASIQFAVAGMNAHVNHDLPLAVVSLCAQRGTAPDTGTLHADYLRVNTLLGAVVGQVRQSYESGLVLAADRDVQPVLDLVGSWSIDRARDAAWVNADVLWRLRGFGPAPDAFAATLAGTVGLVTETLLAPV
jgi:hypothetical protein